MSQMPGGPSQVPQSWFSPSLGQLTLDLLSSPQEPLLPVPPASESDLSFQCAQDLSGFRKSLSLGQTGWPVTPFLLRWALSSVVPPCPSVSFQTQHCHPSRGALLFIPTYPMWGERDKANLTSICSRAKVQQKIPLFPFAFCLKGGRCL